MNFIAVNVFLELHNFTCTHSDMHVSQGRCPSAAAVPLLGASWPHPPQELLLPVALRTAAGGREGGRPREGGREEEGGGNYDAKQPMEAMY